jgi:hypothetical protein
LRADKESLEAEVKKVEKMQEKVKNMQHQQRLKERAAKKSKPFSWQILIVNDMIFLLLGQRDGDHDANSTRSSDNDYESEEDSNPITPGFSSSVRYKI